MKLKLLSLCLAQMARADIEVKVALCSSTSGSYNGYAKNSWTKPGDRYSPPSETTLKISFNTVDPIQRTFARAAHVYLLDDIDTSWFVQKTPWHVQSQILPGVTLDDVETATVEFDAWDILCLETLEISDPNCDSNTRDCPSFKLIQKFDNHNYDPADMDDTFPNNWVSATGKMITFWTGNCVADGRGLSQTSPFQTSCHDRNTFTITLRDECEDGSHNCVGNAVCTDKRTSYKCTCKAPNVGYAYDVDESFYATLGEPCHLPEEDECENGTHDCDSNATCRDLADGFACDCNNGYEKKGKTCKDEDECKDGSHNCGENEQCTNTDGSFECICKEGYTIGRGKCIDQDECSDGSHNCGENEQCTNTNGSFDCGCYKGYHKQGGICVDDDECKDGTHNCDYNEKCVNVDGSFSCDCKVGFVLVDGECEDDDECANDNQCGEHGECSNTEGSFDCGCKDGYHKKAGVCVDIDECKKHDHPCGDAPDLAGHAESICTNTGGSHECDCPEGYAGDAYNGECKQNDECKDGTHSCVVHSTCVNNDEGYDCACDAGYVGNGKDECFKDDVDGICRQPNIDYGDWLVPWPKIQGCQYPTCEATYEVVDAWKRATNNERKPWTYGWSILISVPSHHYDGEKDGWSVLVRLPADIEKGSFQVWNAKFFNFYEDDKGYFVLIHSKWSTVRDLAHKHSFNLIAERTSTWALPALLFWDNRQTIHSCFQPSMHSPGNQRTLNQSLEDFLKDTKRTMADDFDGVRKLVIANGRIVRAY